MRQRERERGGLRRACELSSGRRRHWKNRTEINRSVFFAELEYGLSLSLVPPTISSAPRPPLADRLVSSLSVSHPSIFPSLFLSVSPPVRPLVFPAPRSFLPSLPRLSWLGCSPRLLEFTLLLPDRPGRLRWTFDVDR